MAVLFQNYNQLLINGSLISDYNQLLNMAVFSTIKNKKNKKLREGIDDLAVKCGDGSDTVDVSAELDSPQKRSLNLIGNHFFYHLIVVIYI